MKRLQIIGFLLFLSISPWIYANAEEVPTNDQKERLPFDAPDMEVDLQQALLNLAVLTEKTVNLEKGQIRIEHIVEELGKEIRQDREMLSDRIDGYFKWAVGGAVVIYLTLFGLLGYLTILHRGLGRLEKGGRP